MDLTDLLNLTRHKCDTNASSKLGLRRDILKCKRLSDAELKTIKSEVQEQIKSTESSTNPDTAEEINDGIEREVSQNEGDTNRELLDSTSPHSGVEISQEDTNVEEIKQIILEKWDEIKETGFTDRNSLPKINLNRKAKKIIKFSNSAILLIKEARDKPLDINELNDLIYAAACAITEKIGKKIINRQQKQRKQPFWKVKIEKEINELRRDLSMLT